MAGPVLLPPNFLDEFNALKEKVDRLANSPQAIATSVKEGAFTVLDSGGARRVQLGKQDDASYGVTVWDANAHPLLTQDKFTANDGTRDRVVIGKLDNVPNYGLQVFDAAGGVILDAVGLQQPIKEIATHNISPQNQDVPFTLTSGQDSAHALDVAGTMSGTFYLSRPASILLLGYMTGRVSVGSTYAFAQLVVKASGTVVQGPFYAGLWDSRNGGYTSFTSWASIVPLGAGTFTTNWQAYGDNGVTLAVYSGHISVFKLGG